MGKLSKLIRAIGLITRKPYLLNKVLEDKEANKDLVLSRYNLPLGLNEIAFKDLVKHEVTIDPFCFLEGGSLPTDLALLKALASVKNNCSYFEIGTWRGESVANVAAVAKECFTLNLSNEELKQLGLDSKYIGLQRSLSSNLPNVKHISANSLEFDYKGLNKKFDLIFIDGDHRYEAVRSDGENCFRELRHDQTIIVWHDYKYAPDEIRWEVLLGILDAIPKEHHKHLYAVSNTLCAIYYPFPIEAKPVEYPVKPEKNFRVTIG
jgi:predicted O-methyltransferase YrrM